MSLSLLSGHFRAALALPRGRIYTHRAAEMQTARSYLIGLENPNWGPPRRAAKQARAQVKSAGVLLGD